MKIQKKLAGLLCAAMLCAAAGSLTVSVYAQQPVQAAEQEADEITLESVEYLATEGSLGSPEERLRGYLYSGGALPKGNMMASRLGELEAALYSRAKVMGAQVAAGTLGDTLVSIPVEETTLNGKRWTAKDLGLSTVVENGAITAEATAAMRARLGVDFARVFRAVMADCPYEMYWCNNSYSYGYFGLKATRVNGIWQIYYTGNIRMRYEVTPAYAAEQTDHCYVADTAKTAGTANAVRNAQAIVARYAGWSDIDKLYAYRDELSALNVYNASVVENNSLKYGDPWQIIYMFDGDESTKVVCEGYAKAFQYLCELTNFESGIQVYSVTGILRWVGGSGGHMWNIVAMPDGSRLLVDITNCDIGGFGSSQLFLDLPDEGSAQTTYDIGNFHYTYDERAWSIYTLEELTLGSVGAAQRPTQGRCGAQASWVLADGVLTVSGTGAMFDYTVAEDVPWYGADVRELRIGADITVIGSRAFQDCTKLETITLGESVQALHENAFAGCTGVRELDLCNVVTIGIQAFRGCTALEEVTIPAGVQAIGGRVFENCTGLKNMTFAGTAPRLATSIFSNCDLTVRYSGDESWDQVADLDYGGKAYWISAKGLRILAHPQDLEADINSVASFTVTARGEDLQFQWQWAGASGTNWKNCTSTTLGWNTETLRPAATSGRNGYRYRCVVTDRFGNELTSEDGQLKVVHELQILVNPTDYTAISGETALFTVGVSGTEPTYRWQYKAPSGSWVNCSSATAGYNTSVLNPVASKLRNGYSYRCVVTNRNGNQVVSEAAVLKVVPAVSILSQSGSQEVVVNQSGSFTVTADGMGLSYRWQYKNTSGGSWANCSSATAGYLAHELRPVATTARNGYQYRCIITDRAGNKCVSEPVTMTVVPALRFLKQPIDYYQVENNPATFTVRAAGDNLTYRWQYKNTSGGSWANCSSTTAGYNTDTINPIAAMSRNGYSYRCVVTDGSGKKITSEAAVLHVYSSLRFTWQPSNQTAFAGETVTFSVEVIGSGVTYQWQYRPASGGSWVNCSSATVGYNTSALHPVVTKARDGHQYRCVVTDENGKRVISDTAVLTLKPSLSITQQPENCTVLANDTARFRVAAEGDGLIYQWQYRPQGGSWKNCSSITDGYNTAEVAPVGTTARNGHQYRCVITDAAGNKVISEAAELLVVELIPVPTQPETDPNQTSAPETEPDETTQPEQPTEPEPLPEPEQPAEPDVTAEPEENPEENQIPASEEDAEASSEAEEIPEPVLPETAEEQTESEG